VVLLRPDLRVPDGGRLDLMAQRYYAVAWDQLHRDAKASGLAAGAAGRAARASSPSPAAG
jgi:hypothetical protein